MTIGLAILMWVMGIFLGWQLRSIKMKKGMIKSLEELNRRYGSMNYEARYWLLYHEMDGY